MNLIKTRNLIVSLILAYLPLTAMAAPPYNGTVFLDPDIITESDPTTFTGLEYTGQGMRTMFDRRINDWAENNAYLFLAHYADAADIEIQVNPEYGNPQSAQSVAEYYAPVFGRLPAALRKDVETSWIHLGDEAFGGGNNNLLIHTGSLAQSYIDDGILEETLVHEAAHTSLDPYYADAAGWLAAQDNDPDFISTYARDNPDREDIAESFLTYIAVRFRANRISNDMAAVIEQTIPNRIEYFDSLELDLTLLEAEFSINAGLNDAWYNPDTDGQGFFITVFPDLGFVSMAWFTYDTEFPPNDATANLGDPGHRWITAAGVIVGNKVVMDIVMTSGGVFDTDTEIQRTEPPGSDGTITLTFESCNSATIEYDIKSIGKTGTIPVQRVAEDNVVVCEALNSE